MIWLASLNHLMLPVLQCTLLFHSGTVCSGSDYVYSWKKTAGVVGEREIWSLTTLIICITWILYIICLFATNVSALNLNTGYGNCCNFLHYYVDYLTLSVSCPFSKELRRSFHLTALESGLTHPYCFTAAERSEPGRPMNKLKTLSSAPLNLHNSSCWGGDWEKVYYLLDES